jgi:hypothetical protein
LHRNNRIEFEYKKEKKIDFVLSEILEILKVESSEVLENNLVFLAQTSFSNSTKVKLQRLKIRVI